MDRSPPFRKRDLTRAVRALEAAGLTIGRVEITKDGRLALIPAGQDAIITPQSDLDRELEEFEARRGQD